VPVYTFDPSGLTHIPNGLLSHSIGVRTFVAVFITPTVTSSTLAS
jgi:hypothetical protein